MALTPDNHGAGGAQSKIRNLTCEERADLAFKAHAALMKLQASDTALLSNPYWSILRMESFERFTDALKRIR